MSEMEYRYHLDGIGGQLVERDDGIAILRAANTENRGRRLTIQEGHGQLTIDVITFTTDREPAVSAPGTGVMSVIHAGRRGLLIIEASKVANEASTHVTPGWMENVRFP